MWRQPLNIVALVLAAYVLVCVLAYVFQARLVFFPDRAMVATPADIGLGFEEVFLPATDGPRLHAWFVPAPEARYTVLFCHGNAGNISHRLDSIRIFHDLGLAVLIFDYRGYGRSEGHPSESGTYADAAGAYRYLVDERGVAPGDIILFGRSLGSAVAVELASRVEARALIAESAFTRLPDVGQRAYPVLPVKWLSTIRYDSLSRIGRVEVPKLFVHSTADDIIPYDLGRRLYEAASEPKQFVDISGDHNSGFIVSGGHYTDALRAFLDSLD